MSDEPRERENEPAEPGPEPEGADASREDAPAPTATEAQQARRRRWLRIGTFVAFLGVASAFVLPRVPRAQHVRVHLGSGSSRVVRVTARVSRDGSLDRETSFRFDRGAPPAFEWDFELPNGAADVEIELITLAGVAEQKTRVELDGKETTVEAKDAMGRLP